MRALTIGKNWNCFQVNGFTGSETLELPYEGRRKRVEGHSLSEFLTSGSVSERGKKVNGEYEHWLTY